MFIIGTGRRDRTIAAEIAKERLTGKRSGRVRVGERDAEERVRAKIFLIRAAVQLDQLAIDRLLVERVRARETLRDRLIDGLDCFPHTLPRVALLVAIAQLPRFVLARARAARDRGAAKGAALQPNVYLHRRVSARIKNLPPDDFADAGLGHGGIRTALGRLVNSPET